MSARGATVPPPALPLRAPSGPLLTSPPSSPRLDSGDGPLLNMASMPTSLDADLATPLTAPSSTGPVRSYLSLSGPASNTMDPSPLPSDAVPSWRRSLQRATSHLPTLSSLSRSTYVRVSTALLVAVYAVIAVMAALVIWQVTVRREERHVVAWAVAAVFVLLSIPLSLHDVHMHVMHYVRPDLQRYYIRILWMVPIYAVESWLALRFKEQAIYLEVARDMYEAYVIYSFFALLAAYFGGEDKIVAVLTRDEGDTHAHLIFPLCCFRWRKDRRFFRRAAVGVFQYVVIKVVLATVQLITTALDVYGEGEWRNAQRPYIYFLVTLNVSQFVAMYCLVLFYHELSESLKPLNPLGKFLVVKAVVFFSFWQSVIISGLVFTQVITNTLDYSTGEVAAGLQDFIICIEMFFAAVAHSFFFSYRDFMVDSGHPLSPAPTAIAAAARGTTVAQAVVEMLPTDLLSEAKRHVVNAATLTRRPAGGSDDAASLVRAASDGDGMIAMEGAAVDASSIPQTSAVVVTVTPLQAATSASSATGPFRSIPTRR